MRRPLISGLTSGSALACLLGVTLAGTPAQASIRHYISRLIHPIPVTTEYDRDAHLSGHTYSWGDVHMTVTRYAGVVRAAVDHDLQKKGWQQVPSGGAVTVFALGDMQGTAGLKSYYSKQNVTWAGDWGLQGWGAGWKPYHGEATTTAVTVPGNNLVIDMFDTASHRPVFRSVAGVQLWDTAQKNTKYLDDSVKKMLKKLPE